MARSMSMGAKFFLMNALKGLVVGGLAYLLIAWITDVPRMYLFFGWLVLSLLGVAVGAVGWIALAYGKAHWEREADRAD